MNIEAIVILAPILVLAYVAIKEYNRAERLEDENLKLKEENGYFKRCAGCNKLFIAKDNKPEFYPSCSPTCTDEIEYQTA